MSALTKLKSAWNKLRPKQLSDCLTVEWDEQTVRLRVLQEMSNDWNQEFRWGEITKVCFKDEGIAMSDLLFLELGSPARKAIVLTEAQGGPAFIQQLVNRGLFPMHVLNKAVASTNGGMYCWPTE